MLTVDDVLLNLDQMEVIGMSERDTWMGTLLFINTMCTLDDQMTLGGEFSKKCPGLLPWLVNGPDTLS